MVANKPLETFVENGEEDGTVSVNISYDIIRHVSSQLYTSPRKAIEELVCNSYDAGASDCYVTLPVGSSDSLLVLDNGKAMDKQGLEELWHVAKSPKANDDDSPRIANGRMQIGKFGVGKLAAYALGERLTHITCSKNTVRLISVGQSDIKDKGNKHAPTFKVYKISAARAKTVVEPLLGTLPRPWAQGWPTWTLAIVAEIDQRAVKNFLKMGLLRRMISTALPVSARFKTHLDGQLIPKREIDPSNIKVTVNVIDPAFRNELSDSLRAYWKEKLDLNDEADVPESNYKLKTTSTPDPEDITKTIKAIEVPSLGPVSGNAIATKASLTTGKLADRHYAGNGFAITALGKLVNPEDALFGISARSHKYWSKFLAQLEMPGLDRVLLVQRNAVSERSPEAEIAQVIIHTLFNFTRKRVDEEDGKEGPNPAGTFGNRLRSSAPILAQAGLKGLLAGSSTRPDLRSLAVDFRTLGIANSAIRFDKKTLEMLVNSDHPLVDALDDQGDTGKQFRRVLGEILAGTQLARGLLMARAVPDELLDDVDELLDASLRTAAEFVRDPVEDHIERIKEASYGGDRPFEHAVIDAFKSLRLVANHHGESDAPDGIIEIARSGQDNLRISVEAKGSQGIIDHKTLAEATVTRHSDEFHCTNAVAIAREYATVGIGKKESALLRETKGKVPLLTVDGIATMLRLHRKRNFDYNKVVDILTTWTHPDELVSFIEAKWQEMPDRGLMHLILTAAHDYITKDSTNRPDPGVIAADPRVQAKRVKKADIRTILTAIQLTTQMITVTNQDDFTFELTAPVDTVLEAMRAEFAIAPGEFTPKSKTGKQ